MKRTLVRGLSVVVWAWSLWSLYNVARWGGAVLIDASTTSRIMAVRTDGQIDSAIGLTYHGLAGAALVVVELALVLAALVFSLSEHHWKRRLSSIVIVAWSLLWAANSVWMETLSHWEHASNTTLLIVITALVLLWTALRWRGDRGTAPTCPARRKRDRPLEAARPS